MRAERLSLSWRERLLTSGYEGSPVSWDYRIPAAKERKSNGRKRY